MTRPNVNVTVGGPQSPTNYTYKTVVLKSNLPFAAQVGEENCIYVIKWDFDLGGDTVEIPANCVLKFDGSSLKNGTVSALGTLNLSGVGNLMNLSLLGVEDGYINIDDSLTILGEFEINHFVIFTDIFKNFLPRAHRVYVNNLMCLDITDILNTIGKLLWESADLRFYRPAPLINIPKDEYVISSTVTLPSGVFVEWNQSTILLGGNLEDFYCDDMSESENDYYMFRIGDMFYGNLIGDPNVRHGNYFRNVYATGVDQTLYDRVIFIYAKTHIHIDSITTKHYKKTVVYNMIRRNSESRDAGYLDNKTLSNILVLERRHDLNDYYDIEVYWGDGCLLEHIQDARCLVTLSDACHLDSCINVKLHAKESNVIVTNYYCSHANINVKNSNVVVQRGHFILGSAGDGARQDNYVPITIRTDIPLVLDGVTLYKKSKMHLVDCEFIGRAFNGTHKFSLDEIEYDIDNDEQSELIIDNCYSRMSGWYENIEVPYIVPFVKNGNYFKNATKDSTNVYLNVVPEAEDTKLSEYIGSDSVLGELYIFVASWLDKSRKIGMLTKITAGNPEKPVYINDNSAKLLRIEITQEVIPNISKELTFYVGKSVSGHIIWKEASLSVLNWNNVGGKAIFYYNGKTINNNAAFKPCDFADDIIDESGNITVNMVLNKGNHINRKDECVEAYCSYLPVMGTWKDGDRVTVGADIYEYDTNDFLCVNGTYGKRPKSADFEGKRSAAGFLFYNRTYNRNERWNGSIWLNEDAIDLTNVTYSNGTTAARETMSLSSVNGGFKYYDTDLLKYVLWNGTAWTNLDGTSL